MTSFQERIQIVGAGAVGSFLAAALQEKNSNISFVDSRKNIENLSNHAYTFNSVEYSFKTRQKVESGLVFICLKSHHIMPDFIDTLESSGSTVVFLQNGLNIYTQLKNRGPKYIFSNISALEARLFSKQLNIGGNKPNLLVSKEFFTGNSQNRFVDLFNSKLITITFMENYHTVLASKYPRWLLTNILNFKYKTSVGQALSQAKCEFIDHILEDLSMVLKISTGISINKVDLINQIRMLPPGLTTSSFRDNLLNLQNEFFWELNYLLSNAKNSGYRSPLLEELLT